MELKEARESLDKLDKELITIVTERMNLVRKVAEYKKEKKLPMYDPEREKELIEARRKLAEELGINPDLVEDIFKRILEDSHRIGKEIVGE